MCAGVGGGLRSLCLRSNRLTELTPKLGELVGLVTLDLSRNSLTALPAEIERCSALVTLARRILLRFSLVRLFFC